jgi:hypothetical protein
LILQDWGWLDEALALLKKSEAICLELGNRQDLAISYENIAQLHRARGDLAEARQKAQESLAIFTDLKMPREIEHVTKLLAALDGKTDQR